MPSPSVLVATITQSLPPAKAASARLSSSRPTELCKTFVSDAVALEEGG